MGRVKRLDMSLVFLDTHVWLWWLHDPKVLSPRARKLIKQAEGCDEVRVSAISVWEIGVKVSVGKLTLPLGIEEWFEEALRYPGIGILPIEAEDALASTRLPGDFHKDPADRIIVAQTRRYHGTLVTHDKLIRRYRHVKTVT